MHKHRGMTIVELLGAIVIFSIASSIIALTISFIINANQQIIENGQANTTGMLAIKTLESEISDLYIPRVTYSDDQSISLVSEYEPSIINGNIVDDYSNPKQLDITFINNQLIINNEVFSLSPFTLDSSSYIEKRSDNQYIINLVLASEDNTYTFKTIIDIPVLT